MTSLLAKFVPDALLRNLRDALSPTAETRPALQAGSGRSRGVKGRHRQGSEDEGPIDWDE